MTKKILTAILFMAVSFSLVAQENECYEVKDKKAKKYFEEGSDKKKNKKAERLEFLKKALELEPDYPEANILLAEEMIKTARYDGRSIKPAEKYLKTAVAACPESSLYAYFYLGEIAFQDKRFRDAEKYYAQFIKNPDKIKKDADYNEAEEFMKLAAAYKDIYENPVPFNPIKIQEICTADDEYLAIFSPDNEFLFFTKRYMKKDLNSLYDRWVEEFTLSEKKENKLQKPVALPSPFNEGDNYGGVTMTADNKEMYITICKPIGDYNNCDIYTITWKSDTWGELEKLGPEINTEDGWESQPSISADGKTLFYSYVKKGDTHLDIYYATRNADGSWNKAENIGAPINTTGNEKSPFIHSDSQTLYFSTDGQMGVGKFDIYYTRKDQNNKWIKPINLGIPINTEEDEIGFFVSTDGKKGYFSSNKVKGSSGWDVYGFDLYEKARPQQIVFLKGDIKDAAGNIPQNATVELKNPETKEITKVKVDAEDGKFVAVLAVPRPTDLVLTIKEPGKTPEIKLIQSKNIEIGKAFEIGETEIKELKVNGTYTINDIFYKTNSADLANESKIVLDEMALFLKENPTIKIAIHGHTDDIGDDKANLALSTDRAFTVMEYLQSKGVNPKKLSFKGFGETKPILPNTSETNRAKNRRTEFVILEK